MLAVRKTPWRLPGLRRRSTFAMIPSSFAALPVCLHSALSDMTSAYCIASCCLERDNALSLHIIQGMRCRQAIDGRVPEATATETGNSATAASITWQPPEREASTISRNSSRRFSQCDADRWLMKNIWQDIGRKFSRDDDRGRKVDDQSMVLLTPTMLTSRHRAEGSAPPGFRLIPGEVEKNRADNRSAS